MQRKRGIIMKKLLSVLLVLLAFGLFGCDQNPEPGNLEPTYVVYTFNQYYSEVEEYFPNLEDGMFGKFVISPTTDMSGLEQYQKSWTKAQIKDYFLGRGFADEMATEASSWLITIDRGMVVSRTGDLVYTIVK